MTSARWALAMLLWLATAGAAAAHGGGLTGFAKISVHGQTVRYSLSLGPDVMSTEAFARALGEMGASNVDELASLVARHVAVAADGAPCAPIPATVTPPSGVRGMAVAVVHYACASAPRELAVRDDLVDAFGADYHTLASFEREGGALQVVFEAERRAARVAMKAAGASTQAAPAPDRLTASFLQGLEHILLGFDHLLFVLALSLRGGRIWALLAVVTAFTAANGVALALSALGVASLPASLVEPAIALAIAYVALENVFGVSPISRRLAVCLALGLVHGLGSAGAFAGPGAPPDSLATVLLGFSLGVEAGQATVLALVAPLLLWLRSVPWRRRAVAVASAALLALGLALVVGRALA